MAQLTVADYDALESAIRDGRRVIVRRQHQDVVILRNRREAIEARHPATGDRLLLWVDEAEGVEVVG